MPRFGLFDADAAEPREVYSARMMASENGTLLLYHEAKLNCVIAAIHLKEGQRIQQIDGEVAVLKPA